jgi:hypothetical protein
VARVYSFNFIDIGDYSAEYPVITWTCGEGQTAVIREMTYTAPDSIFDGASQAMRVTCGATTAVIWSMWFSAIDPGRTYMWEGREVMNGVGSLSFIGPGIDHGSFRANGYLFES